MVIKIFLLYGDHFKSSFFYFYQQCFHHHIECKAILLSYLMQIYQQRNFHLFCCTDRYICHVSNYRSPPTTVIFLPWNQLFRVMFLPFSIQINWCIVSHGVMMLVGANNALSGDLYVYFVIWELLSGTSKFIMWCASL